MKTLESKKVNQEKELQVESKREFISPSVCKDTIVKTLKSMSGKYSTYDLFSDWVEVMALSIANGCRLVHDSVWKTREDRYFQIYAKYTNQEFENFSLCFAYLVQSFENFNFDDVLGSIYMMLECGNKESGQFFTPYSVSQLMSEITIPANYDGKEVITVNEPTVGAGGMIIAAAQTLHERGYNPQRCMKIVAQDLDWKAVYMSYVQFSLLGLNAEVAQGNTLTEPYNPETYPMERVLLTPNRCGILL